MQQITIVEGLEKASARRHCPEGFVCLKDIEVKQRGFDAVEVDCRFVLAGDLGMAFLELLKNAYANGGGY